MLRAVSSIYIESQALELLTTARRDVFKLFRTSFSSTPLAYQTVLTSTGSQADNTHKEALGEGGARPPPPPARPPPPPPRPPHNPRQAWTVAAAALALTASIGGVYFYRKLNDEDKEPPAPGDVGAGEQKVGEAAPEAYPRRGAEFPARVQYLLVGGGTASFAAMRAIRSARPDAQVLIVGEEPALPYMRPPLSKELWREPELARAADHFEALTFRQWNGKRRSVVYEPRAFYAPVERLAAGEGGACVARGWRVVRLDVARHEAELRAADGEAATLRYDKCLVATGVRARRAEALRPARDSGRVLTLRSAADAARLASLLDRPETMHVAIVGGGFLASELSASLAERLRGTGARVTQVFREAAPMAGVLPDYLAAEAARRLQRAGVHLQAESEVVDAAADAAAVTLRLAGGAALEAQLVVECVGSEVDLALAAASALEAHPELGGLLVNAELQARADVWAAGDVACFYDVALGRRRVEHHDHAVVSGRLAGENMAAVNPPKHYTHQSMFWSDLGPDLGYEAIGIIDSRLPTVGVFSADAVADATAEAVPATLAVAAAAGGDAPLQMVAAETPLKASGDEVALVPGAKASSAGDATAKRYERGVVFYLREKRIVGVLLWNLFNRMHVARQVLAQGEFEDLFEVAKLFTLNEDE
ncbi:hypothetical protein ABMA28_003681 [Loxostege sticticalis]|uniref:Apoptosis-inducing factor 1, mitochondrial n=1 Tax=Loxostege sticticalis TaxID=481309 RepID=A0ABD0SX28_LOXSC